MTQYLMIDAITREVLGGCGLPDEMGPPAPPPVQEGVIFQSWQTARLSYRDRPSPAHVLQWPVGALDPIWSDLRTLTEKRERKAVEIDAACADQIVSGFMSSALGAPYDYPAKLTDQANLLGSVTDSLLAGGDPMWSTPFWCALDGAWAYRPHTIAEIQQVGRDGKAAILSAMGKNELLRQQISLASEDQLNSITW